MVRKILLKMQENYNQTRATSIFKNKFRINNIKMI